MTLHQEGQTNRQKPSSQRYRIAGFIVFAAAVIFIGLYSYFSYQEATRPLEADLKSDLNGAPPTGAKESPAPPPSAKVVPQPAPSPPSSAPPGGDTIASAEPVPASRGPTASSRESSFLDALESGSIIASDSGPRSIIMSAYGLLDKQCKEDPVYGLHTYIILIEHQEMGRNASFLHFLLKTTLIHSLVSPSIKSNQLNMMYIPTKNVYAAFECIEQCEDLSEAAKQFLSDHYDFTLAARKLSAFRARCRSEFKDPNLLGPYLITLVKPLKETEPSIGEYLFLDMSMIPTAALPEFVTAYKQQVTEPNFPDRQKLDTFRLAVLNYLMLAADRFPEIRGAIAADLQGSVK